MNRASISLAVLAAILVLLPFFVGNYALSVATLVLYFAYTGQAWNVMMGFAGQLSLGHALYVGVGAYAAGALFFYFGIGPWAGVWLAILLCVALGLVIGFLAFRFAISGLVVNDAVPGRSRLFEQFQAQRDEDGAENGERDGRAIHCFDPLIRGS